MKENKMKFLSLILIVSMFIGITCSQKEKENTITQKQDSAIYNIRVIDIDGNEQMLSDYKGKVLLIVNVAS